MRLLSKGAQLLGRVDWTMDLPVAGSWPVMCVVRPGRLESWPGCGGRSSAEEGLDADMADTERG